MLRKPIHPAWYASVYSLLFIVIIVLLNYEKQVSRVVVTQKNTYSQTQNTIQDFVSKAERETKTLVRFQAKKYGIEKVEPGETIPLP